MAGDFKESAFIAHQTFREIAKQAIGLATGLQSLAPSNTGNTSKSAQYLDETAHMLQELNEQLKELMLSESSVASKE